MRNKYRLVILGGGIAGLTLGWKLSEKGFPVLILERETKIGGLSRTDSYKKFLFDYSAHRFNSNNHEVIKKFKFLLGKHCIKKKKKTYIKYWNNYLTYPPRAIELIKKMPIRLLIPAALDLILSIIFQKKNKSIKSFRDWTRNAFGKTLSIHLNEKYAEKIWKTKADLLAPDWAAIRIGRFDLINFLTALFFPNHYNKIYSKSDPDNQSFYYSDLGIGLLPEAMGRKIVELGSQIKTKAVVSNIAYLKKIYRITYYLKGQRKIIYSKTIASSIPLDILISIISPSPSKNIKKSLSSLKYLSVIVVNILIKKSKVTDAHWIYYPQKDIIFNYIVEFKNWSKKMAPKYQTSISANITCMPEDNIWKKNNQELINQVIDNLIELKLIKKDDILDGYVSRLPYAYPIYYINYKPQLEKIKKYIKSLPNFYLLGRTGNFDYANADVVMEKSLNLADEIIKKSLSKPSGSANLI